MAKKSMVERERKREKLVSKYEKKRLELKSKLKKTVEYDAKLEVYKRIQEIPRNAFPSRLRNRCWVTGRSRGYYRDFGLSRHVLREMVHDCLLPGVTKSSW